MPADTKTKTPVKRKAPASSQVLSRLVRMISRADDFVLGFVKCNHPSQQKGLRREFLARLGDKRVLQVELDRPLVSLLDELATQWDADNPPDVVCVYGLEKSINERQEASPVLGRLNNDRDLLRRAVPVPLLIWLPDFALDFIARGAPDFWAWRSGVYEFETGKALWQQEGTAAVIPNVLGVYSLNRQDKVTQLAHLKELLRTAESLPREGKREKDLIASLMGQLGLIYQSLGQWNEATAVYQQGLAILKDLGDKSGIASALHQLANVHFAQGDLAEAERLSRQSLGMKEDLGDKSSIARSLHQLAMLEQGRGNLEEAERLTHLSLGINEDLGEKHGVASNLHQLANLYYVQGNLTEAERFSRQGLGLDEDLGDKNGIASDLLQLAMLEQDRGNLAEAKRLYHQSLHITQLLGDKNGVANINWRLGRLYQELGQLQTALQYYVFAWLSLYEMHSLYQQMARAEIFMLWNQIGDGQFNAWLAEGFGLEAVEIWKKLGQDVPGPPVA